MIFLEKIKTKITAAILFKDELSPDKKRYRRCILENLRDKKKPEWHSTGYFLLVDAAEEYMAAVGGRFYKEESIIIDASSLTPTLPVGSKPSSQKYLLLKLT